MQGASLVTLTINRKPQGIFSKSPATPLQDKTDTAYKMKAGDQIPQLNEKQKPADKTPWRHDKTPEQKP
ncbi:osmoprotectant transport activator ProQ [Escherichia coli]|nr:osmoprotectant transport activator ProQ [Escherichia coli]